MKYFLTSISFNYITIPLTNKEFSTNRHNTKKEARKPAKYKKPDTEVYML